MLIGENGHRGLVNYNNCALNVFLILIVTLTHLRLLSAFRLIRCRQSKGFFRSIALSHGSSLQDTLRLLTLWFDYGHWPEVYEALVEGVRTIDVNTWLQVIPQLIARIDTQRQLVGRLIHQLLMDIGKAHPQVLFYLSLCITLFFYPFMIFVTGLNLSINCCFQVSIASST